MSVVIRMTSYSVIFLICSISSLVNNLEERFNVANEKTPVLTKFEIKIYCSLFSQNLRSNQHLDYLLAHQNQIFENNIGV